MLLDNDPAAGRHLRERFGGHEHVRVCDGDILDPAVAAALRRECLDTVVSMNVLEHIADDSTALEHMYHALQPGGHLILLVPAHPGLYGTLDARLEHLRRYERNILKVKVRRANLTLRRCLYFNGLGVAGWYLAGRVLRQERIGEGQVRFYDRYVVPLLARAERVIPPPFGQSLIVIGRK